MAFLKNIERLRRVFEHRKIIHAKSQQTNSNNVFPVNENCCGCGACVAVCPKSCIDLYFDAAGFPWPQIVTNACVACGLCLKTCPMESSHGRSIQTQIRWAKARDDEMLESSSSGGVFGVLASRTLVLGGIVVGAAFDQDQRVLRHTFVYSANELREVQKSKYLQSLISKTIYEQIVFALKEGRCVLFCGTACQVSALNNYLGVCGIDCSALLTVDIICHGVPAPALWMKYVDYLNFRLESKINFVDFRSKSTEWLTFSLLFKHNKEKILSEMVSSNWYMKAFFANASLRKSCFKCSSKRNCGSDITLGDFWGIQAAHPEVDYKNGVSVVLLNTEHGLWAFGSVAAAFDYGESDMGKVLLGNPTLVSSVKPYKKYDQFMHDLYSDVPIVEMMSRWMFRPSFYLRIRRSLGQVKRRLIKQHVR